MKQVLLSALASALVACTAFATQTATAMPASVALVGNLQSEAGCPGDYDLGCLQTRFIYDANDDVWQRSLFLPAGTYNYFAALNGTFDVTYGLHGGSALQQVTLVLATSRVVDFFYDDKTHWVTDNVTTPIVTLAGSFQSELGCPGDFQPRCLRSWLEDVDGDGVYTLTAALPAGIYSTVVTIDRSFDETYHLGGGRTGENIPIVVTGSTVSFCYENTTHILRTDAACSAVVGVVPEPDSGALVGIGVTALLLGVRSRRRLEKRD